MATTAAEATTSEPRPARHILVDRVLVSGTPEVVRLGAARGALPIPVHDLTFLQIKLLKDHSPTVAAAAQESLDLLTIETLLPVLRDPSCEAAILDHFARSGRLTGDALSAAISHPSIPESTLEVLAATAEPEALGLIVTNEIRLIQAPHLVGRLRSNPKLPGHLARRLIELERDFIGRDPIRLRQVAPETAREVVNPAAVPPPAPEGSPIDGAPADVLPGEEPRPDVQPLLEEEFEEEMRKTDAYQRIMRLNVAERNILAMKGNSEERSILIRDTARTVAMGVLKNPRLSDTEITHYAAMRNVSEDILRGIASNREWTKSYAVSLALVRNPKTPPGLSIQFLARLGTRDLKVAMADKNIPELVRRNARNLFQVRTQPPKKIKKAH